MSDHTSDAAGKHDAGQSLAEKLARFDPVLHGGEVMMTEPIGGELLDSVAAGGNGV